MHARLLQARPARAEHDGADGVLDVARRGAPRLSGLQRGECDMALAGGVSIVFPERPGYLYQEGMIFSPDGTAARSTPRRAAPAPGPAPASSCSSAWPTRSPTATRSTP